MSEQPQGPMTWPEIQVAYPELTEKLRAGDMPSRVEFARLMLGGTIISVEPRVRGGRDTTRGSGRPTGNGRR